MSEYIFAMIINLIMFYRIAVIGKIIIGPKKMHFIKID
jgi:hypothetical protein